MSSRIHSKRPLDKVDYAELNYEDVAHLTASSPVRGKSAHAAKVAVGSRVVPLSKKALLAPVAAAPPRGSTKVTTKVAQEESVFDDEEEEARTPLHPAPKRKRPEDAKGSAKKSGSKKSGTVAPTPSPRQRRVVIAISFLLFFLFHLLHPPLFFSPL